MPVTPYTSVAMRYDADRHVALTEPMSVLEACQVTVHSMRCTEFVESADNDFTVTPVLLLSDDGGWSFTTYMDPDSGSTVNSPGLDAWENGPWVWSLPWNGTDNRDKTQFRLGVKARSQESGVFLLCRAQLTYAIKRRRVVRVPSFRKLIACQDSATQWRTTRAIRPHVVDGHMRVTYECHAPTGMDSADASVGPIWFYNDEPGDETAWYVGGSNLGAPHPQSPGTYTTPGISVSDLTDHPLIAFGWEISRSAGSSGDTAFAVVEGTFALY